VPQVTTTITRLLLGALLGLFVAGHMPVQADDDDGPRETREGRDSDDRGARAERGGPRAFIEIERNERGGDRQRDEVLVIGPLDVAADIRRAGYRVLSERRLDSLQQALLRIRVRDRETIEEAIESLRQQVPGVRVAPNHVYQPSGQAPAPDAVTPDKKTGARVQAPVPARIGIIDTGADTAHARLRDRIVAKQGFAADGYVARPHGTAVAQLASSLDAPLAVADVFELDRRRRLVAPAEAIAAAIDWLLAAQLRVINISIEGPRNEVLEFVIAEALARGTAIVAAAGNNGPAAPPGYPAAYPGVVAVAALDEKGRIYRRSARGKHVQFAARGSFAGSAPPVLSRERLSGTSFAAPLVSAELERRWRSAPEASRDQVLAALRSDARDLGDPGRDPVYGWGQVDPFAR
jgi:minor extracellular protease Epr